MPCRCSGSGVERGRIAPALGDLADRFLHAREIHQTLAHHRGRDLAEIRAAIRDVERHHGGLVGVRRDHADQIAFEPILDVEQAGGDRHQSRLHPAAGPG